MALLLACLAFLSAGIAEPLALRSFPTRRSSDLGGSVGRNRHRRLRSYRRSLRDEARDSMQTPIGAQTRSEEHTSELQSRENLVCRLLLEKKKSTWSRCLCALRAWVMSLVSLLSF